MTSACGGVLPSGIGNLNDMRAVQEYGHPFTGDPPPAWQAAPMDRSRSCTPSPARDLARHGFQRQLHARRTGDERLERPLRLHLLSSAVGIRPVRRSGTLRPASGQRSQRRRMGRRSEAGRGALSWQGLAPLLPRRRGLRQSRGLRLPGSRRHQIRHSAARQPRLAG